LAPFRAFGTMAHELRSGTRYARHHSWLWQENAPTVQVRTHDGTLRSKYKAALFKCSFVVVSIRFCYARNRRMQPANPRRPVPTKPKLAGSGTAEGGSTASGANREEEVSRSDCVAGGGGVIEV
jgi:hypothetical protein